MEELSFGPIRPIQIINEKNADSDEGILTKFCKKYMHYRQNFDAKNVHFFASLNQKIYYKS